MRALRAPFDEGAELHFEFKIVRVNVLGAEAFDTEALLHVTGPAGGLLQQNARWRTGWSVLGKDAAVRLRSIDVQDYEEVAVPNPLFGEVTTYVFGEIPRFRQEFLRGVPEYFRRTDFFMIGNSLPGMHGFALGDVDGDGRDDIYVVQQGGLANRLFLCRPDGTAEDVTERSGLGFLEEARSALIVDLDGDGHQDVAIAIGSVTLLAFNDGTGAFADFVLLRAQGIQEGGRRGTRWPRSGG